MTCCRHHVKCRWPRAPFICDNCIVTGEEGAYEIRGKTLDQSNAMVEAAFDYVEDFVWRRFNYRWSGTCHALRLRPCDVCECVGDCRCGRYRRIDISGAMCHRRPIEVVQWRVDGEPQPLKYTAPDGSEQDVWRLDECRYLVPQGEHGCGCGCCATFGKQNPQRPAGTPGTWDISIRYGEDPPLMIQRGVADMVIEQIKACVTPDECALPGNIDKVQRGDVTYTMRALSETNSGVWTWDNMFDVYGERERVEWTTRIQRTPILRDRVVVVSDLMIVEAPPVEIPEGMAAI